MHIPYAGRGLSSIAGAKILRFVAGTLGGLLLALGLALSGFWVRSHFRNHSVRWEWIRPASNSVGLETDDVVRLETLAGGTNVTLWRFTRTPQPGVAGGRNPGRSRPTCKVDSYPAPTTFADSDGPNGFVVNLLGFGTLHHSTQDLSYSQYTLVAAGASMVLPYWCFVLLTTAAGFTCVRFATRRPRRVSARGVRDARPPGR